MTNTTNRGRIDGRLTRAAVFGLLAFAAVLCQERDAAAQWVTNGSNINNTNTGNVGINTTSPGARLDVSGRLRMFDYAPPGTTGSTDAGYLFGSNIPSGLITEVGGELVNFGINTPQFGGSNAVRSGGLMRVDTRTSERRFVFYAYPIGNNSGIDRFSVHLDTGNVFMAANGGNVGIGTSSPAAQYKLDVAGDMRVSGNIAAKYQDVAEWVPSTQKLAVGTVVIVDNAGVNRVLASTAAYDTGVAGVVSGQPGLILGEAGEGKLMIATTGRVKVKVDATRLPIRAGDLLVSSDVAGVAMRSAPVSVAGITMHRPGTIIGKALEPLEKGTGEILVLLSLQ